MQDGEAASMESTLIAFSKSLARFLNEGKLPREVVGDLSDLLGTAEQLCEHLREIADKGEKLPKKELRRQLFLLQIKIEQDLPMIIEDLLPPLRAFTGDNFSKRDE